jgi:hypothetical protein
MCDVAANPRGKTRRDAENGLERTCLHMGDPRRQGTVHVQVHGPAQTMLRRKIQINFKLHL